MTPSGGAKTWFTAAELADLRLPGLPRGRRKINELAQRDRWAFATDSAGAALARARPGRGGGLEYHRALLPHAAAIALATAQPPVPANQDGPIAVSSPAWAWLERQCEDVRVQARARLKAIEAVEALESAGLTRTAAVAAVSGTEQVATSTLWNWIKLISGVERGDRLPAVAPRRQGGGLEAAIHPQAWDYFKSDYLRASKPTIAACYGRVQRAGAEQGWGKLPTIKTFRRKLEREVDPRAILLARAGVDELRRSAPAQERSVAELQALELVNIDGHRWDIFVRWPDGTIARPVMVAIQDVFSRKMLAWRIAETETADSTRLAFADLFRQYGIPGACLFDNGRAFASKMITGGAKSRFRFKVLDSDPQGLMAALGISIHWATPYRGQSKPIERAFGDFCGRIATHPAFEGAYTGNSPLAKPENYGSKAIPIEEFRRVVAAEVADHNARLGRETEMGRGVLSFDQVFEQSYATAPIRKASAEHLRMALLAAERVRSDSKTGSIDLYGNRYWAEGMVDHRGEHLVVRFDPEDLHGEIHVYDLAQRYLLTAEVHRAVGFLDREAATRRARFDTQRRKLARGLLEVERRIEADQLAAMLPAHTPEPSLSPNVIRPVRVAQRGSAALALVQDDTPAPVSNIDNFLKGAARLRSPN